MVSIREYFNEFEICSLVQRETGGTSGSLLFSDGLRKKYYESEMVKGCFSLRGSTSNTSR